MSASLTSGTESDFVCDCEPDMRSACAGEPFYKEYEGKRYCVLHFPGEEKSADFESALQRKLDNRDFDFQGVWFPDFVIFNDFGADANFRHATFSAEAVFISATFSAGADFRDVIFSAEVYFSGTTFNAGATFENATFKAKALFGSAIFSVASFAYAKFSAEAIFGRAMFNATAYFHYATFSAQANFRDAIFRSEVYFSGATFNAEADFRSASFGGKTVFLEATLDGRVRFAGSEKVKPFSSVSSLDLQFAKIERPDRVSFHTLTLHPHWFINVDARRFDFTNIFWENDGQAKPELELLKHKAIEELELLKRRAISEQGLLKREGISSPHRLLTIACRKLAANSEENDRYREASNFRRMAMDAERLENWRGFDFRKLNWWYWLASGYGERITRAALVLLGIWIVAGLIYTRVGFARWEPRLASETDVTISKRDDIGAPLKFSRALTYSAGVMTLQKPEPRPATTAAQTVVLLETILGPVQAALLALAIRRKFMR